MHIFDKIYIESDKIDMISQELVKTCIYPNPVFYNKKRNGYISRDLAKTLYNYTYKNINNTRYLVLPFGKLAEVKKLLQSKGLPTRFLDKRQVLPQIDINFTPPPEKNIALSSAQLTVCETLIKNTGGLIQMGCGGGKSIAMLNFISQVKQPTLIIVHTSTLHRQWVGAIQSMCSGNFTLGKLINTTKKMGDVVVATIGTLGSICCIDSENPDYSILCNFGCIILDECHHVAARTFKTIIDNAPSKYKVGVTGTTGRKDKLEFLIFDSFGPIIKKIEDNELKDRITSFTYEFVPTTSTYHVKPRRYFARNYNSKRSYINMDFNDCVDHLIADADRNALIIERVFESIRMGHRVLVLTYRTEHAKLLYEALSKKYVGYLLIGDNSKKFNADKVNSDPQFNFIVANRKIAGEGMDIPSLSCLHLTLPTSDENMLKQYVARIRRFCKDKQLEAHVVDYMDSNITCDSFSASGEHEEEVNILKIMAFSRAKHYKKFLIEYNKNPEAINGHKRCVKDQ